MGHTHPDTRGSALPDAGQPEPAHHDAAFADQARMGHTHPDTRGSALPDAEQADPLSRGVGTPVADQALF